MCNQVCTVVNLRSGLLGNRETGVRFPIGIDDISLLNNVQTSSIGDPASCQMRIEATWAKG